jgi:hypothetical protein
MINPIRLSHLIFRALATTISLNRVNSNRRSIPPKALSLTLAFKNKDP